MVGLLILFIVLGFLCFFFLRGFFFKKEKTGKVEPTSTNVDFDGAVKKFQQLIRIPTISRSKSSDEDEDVFKGFSKILPSLFPLVYEKCDYSRIGRRGLLFHWKGNDSSKVSVFMAHYDVVPVDLSQWSKPAFDALIEDDLLWGRGTLDTKGTFAAILETANQLIGRGFIPENDCYLAFSGEEETHGPSAKEIVKHLEEKGVSINFVLDEGGAIIEPLEPITQQRLGLIGIGEKGQMDINLSIKGDGGHASHPPTKSLTGKLAKAIVNIEKKPMKMHLNKPFLEFLQKIGRNSGLLIRTIVANIKWLKPLIAVITKKSGGEINALLRTTFAVTKLKGSDSYNVMPSKVSAGMNVRYLKENTQKEIIDHIKRVSGENDLKVEVVYDTCPSNYSNTNCHQYEILKDCIQQTWSDALIVPYLMIACSDARHYSNVSDKVYRFSAMEMIKEERALIHGNDERIRLKEWRKTLDFYYRLMSRM